MDGEKIEEFFFELPGINEKGKDLALKVSKAAFTFMVEGKPETYHASEIKGELLKDEAYRIARIADERERANEMFQCMGACLAMAADCQGLASIVIRLADELKETANKIRAAQTADEIHIRLTNDKKEP